MQKNAPQHPLFGQFEPFLLIFAKFAPFSSPYIFLQQKICGKMAENEKCDKAA